MTPTTEAAAAVIETAASQRLDWLPVANLRVDHTYQRPLDHKRVKRMAKDPDLDAFGTLIISERADGSFWCIDGQHRIALFHELGWGDQTAPCIILTGLEIPQEARIFTLANSGSNPNALAKFRAQLVEGDPKAVDINRTVRKCGLTVASGNAPGYIQAVAALKTVHDRAGGLVLERVLRHIVNAWGNDATNFQADILLALALIERRYRQPGIDPALLRTGLQKHTPNQLLAQARARKATGSGSVWANELPEAIVVAYNKATRSPSKKLAKWELRTNVREVWT